MLINSTTVAADSPSFSLVDAYQLAQHNDSTSSVFRAEVEASKARTRQFLAAMLPNINVSIYGNARRYKDLNLGTVPYNDSTFSTVATQPIYHPERYSSYQLSKIQSEITQTQYTFTEQDVMYRVANAYFDVLIAQETLATVKSQSTVFTQLYAQAEAAYKNNQVWVTDVDEARASYNQAHIQTINAKSDLEIKKQILRKYTGRVPARLAVFLGEENLIPLVPDELSQWEKLALENSPNIKLAKQDLDGAAEEIDIATAGHYPKVDLIASYSKQNQTSDFFLDSTNVAAGLLLELPIFQGGDTSARISEARAKVNKSRYNLHDITEQVLMNVRQAYLEVSNNRLLVQVTKQSFESSQAVLESTQLGVQNNIRNSLDVINAQLSLFESQRAMVSAAYNFLKSMLSLKIAAGTLTVSDLRIMDRVLAANR